ncbi:hypothetical protein ACOSQ4_022289 [Xanthoceras sorbifolium]
MDQLYSPCSLLEEFFEAICRCLGGDHHRHRDPKTTNSSSDAEREQKFMVCTGQGDALSLSVNIYPMLRTYVGNQARECCDSRTIHRCSYSYRRRRNIDSKTGQVTQCRTSLKIWSKLQRVYSQQSLAKVFQLRQQLQNIKKSSNSIYDFVLKIKNIGDALMVAREEEDLMADLLKEFIANCVLNLVMMLCNAIGVLINNFRDLLDPAFMCKEAISISRQLHTMLLQTR